MLKQQSCYQKLSKYLPRPPGANGAKLFANDEQDTKPCSIVVNWPSIFNPMQNVQNYYVWTYIRTYIIQLLSGKSLPANCRS